jgi:hypothetical protein
MVKDPRSILNNYSGVLQSSECGKDFIKLIPWTTEFQTSHLPWVGTRGEIHIRKDDIRAIVDIDTISERDIEQYANQLKNRGPDKIANGSADGSPRSTN